ncbi:MAG TPA: HEAT repeat domain-containing protein [Polyangiaceae bacterium]|nr:HEAT repeat domain-containing protein [Polyangiaceae bacterium]
MADAVFAGRPGAVTLPQAAAYSLVLLATKGAADAKLEPLPVPDETLDGERALRQLLDVPTSEKDRALALVTFQEPLTRAALTALQTSDARANTVLEALGRGEGTFEPFVGPRESADTKLARERGREVLVALEPSIAALARHPDAALRVKAIALLARSKSEAAQAAMVGALTDPDVNVQRVALNAVGAAANQRATDEVVRVLREHRQWSMRTLACAALGRIGKAGGAGAPAAALHAAARAEPFALVREAALLALVEADAAKARVLAAEMAKSDPEPRVRETAAKVARGEATR